MIAAAALALAACKDKPATKAAAPAAGVAACRETLRGVPALPPHERAAAIVRGCPVCGQSFEPLIVAANGHPDLEQVGLLVAACQTGCSKRALGRWRGLLTDTVPGQGVQRPWRALAEDCPDAMRTDKTTERFASAPWFALAVIGAHLARATTTLPPSAAAELDAARRAVAIPMPPATVVGTGMVVPPGTARAGVPWRAVTISDQALLVARLAIGRLDGAGWHVDAPGRPYPGAPAGADLAAELAALGPAPELADRLDLVVVIAPRAAPAARAVEALARLGATPAAFAVSVPDATSLWRGAIAPHALTVAPLTGARLRLDLVAERVAAVGADGTVHRSAALPAAATLPDRVRAALAAAAGHPLELVRGVPPELDVAGLVALLDLAHAAGATGCALAAPGADATAAEGGPFDAAAFAAALTP